MEILAPLLYLLLMVSAAAALLVWRRQRFLKRAESQQHALAQAQAAAEAAPANPQSWFQLACLCVEAGELEDAAGVYQRVVDLTSADHPLHIEALNHLGNVYDLLGEHEQALGCYHRALELDPDHADLHFNLGTLYLHLEEWDEAAQHLREYLRRDPDSQWAVSARELLQRIGHRRQLRGS